MDWDPKQISDRDLIESVRLGRDAGDDPLVRELQERLRRQPELDLLLQEVQQSDAELVRALKAVRARKGLEQRILARLGRVEELLTPPEANCPSGEPGRQYLLSAGEGTRTRGEIGRRPGRRRWLAIAVSVACVGALGVVGSQLWRRSFIRSTLTALELAHEVSRVFEATLDQFGSGGSVERNPPPPGFRMSTEIRLLPGSTVTWRTAPVMDWTAVVFDITQPGGERGSLFVVQTALADFPVFPPHVPQLQTSQTSLGWWRESDKAYLLAVLGGPRVYQRFLRPPRPIT